MKHPYQCKTCSETGEWTEEKPRPGQRRQSTSPTPTTSIPTTSAQQPTRSPAATRQQGGHVRLQQAGGPSEAEHREWWWWCGEPATASYEPSTRTCGGRRGSRLAFLDKIFFI